MNPRKRDTASGGSTQTSLVLTKIADNKRIKALLDSACDLILKPSKVSIWSSISKKAQKELFYIGHDASGGCLAAWLADADVDNAPVVYLGSEGEEHCIAANIQELIQIFAALGPVWHDLLYGPASLAKMKTTAKAVLAEAAEDTPELRTEQATLQQLLTKAGIPTIDTAVEALHTARQSDGCFAAWLADNQ